MSHREVFGNIYKNQLWGTGSDSSPLSGGGSLPSNAKSYVNFVKDFIIANDIKSVVDFGHGDWRMWEHYKFENVSYLGVDIAEELSNSVQKEYGNSTRTFQQLDLSEQQIPDADLLISKDVLQHLPTVDVVSFLNQISNFDYAIICNDINILEISFTKMREIIAFKKRIQLLSQFKSPKLPKKNRNNSEICAGEFRGIDLQIDPFSSSLKNLKILKIIDYDGPYRVGLKKRIYLFSQQ